MTDEIAPVPYRLSIAGEPESLPGRRLRPQHRRQRPLEHETKSAGRLMTWRVLLSDWLVTLLNATPKPDSTGAGLDGMARG